ncbi:hypothetical protein XELAEV_18021844mg [Xenopus laevis]|uniref:Uncharacterized protein n=1 Tax=Xenopus laevis TaxID=8355 RepID=A0A974HML6_XENLA|nr:hypothetical protein XELAEV_18021844mg [Xenopus laevis]
MCMLGVTGMAMNWIFHPNLPIWFWCHRVPVFEVSITYVSFIYIYIYLFPLRFLFLGSVFDALRPCLILFCNLCIKLGILYT